MNRKLRLMQFREVVGQQRTYPCYLTSDGNEYDCEVDPGYDQWRPYWSIIDRVNCADDWLSFAAAEVRRRLVQKGFSGQRLRDEIAELECEP